MINIIVSVLVAISFGIGYFMGKLNERTKIDQQKTLQKGFKNQ